MSGPPNDVAVGVETESKVEFEDVDDIIDVAARAMDESREYLSIEELQSVAADLDISAEYVEPAIAEVRRRRQTMLAAERAAHKRRRTIVIVVASIIGVFALWVFIVAQGLASKHAWVLKQRSQVTNVLERQVATENRWRGKPDSADRIAELSGSENRVRVERKRYDDAAAVYNASAGGFPGSLAASLTGRPEAVPMSAEILQW